MGPARNPAKIDLGFQDSRQNKRNSAFLRKNQRILNWTYAILTIFTLKCITILKLPASRIIFSLPTYFLPIRTPSPLAPGPPAPLGDPLFPRVHERIPPFPRVHHRSEARTNMGEWGLSPTPYLGENQTVDPEVKVQGSNEAKHR